jgi:hypothetical protein
MIRRVFTATVALASLHGHCWADATAAKAPPYLAAVQQCVETLMRDGTDKYGAEHSPLFSSILDLETHKLPANPPQLLAGQRPQDRAFPGCNLQHDMHTLILMDHLSAITGKPEYAKHVDAYLEFFLRRCAGAGNGLFPCGEHAFWNFEKESVTTPIQEDLGAVPQEFLERMWKINPAAVEKHIRGLERHFLEGDQWVWNRHAAIFGDKRPRDPAAFPRHGGFYIHQWSFLFTKTGDQRLLELGMRTARAASGIDHSVGSMGIALLRAHAMLKDQAPPEFSELGKRYADRLTKNDANDLDHGVLVMYKKLAAETNRLSSQSTWGFWDLLYSGSGGYGFLGAERYAVICLIAHRLTSSPQHLEFARRVCEYYMKHPRPAEARMTPGKFAGIIALSLQLHDLTKEERYLEYGKSLADDAMKELYAGGLFRGATGASHYEAANGTGALMTELVRLHLLLTGNRYPLPRCENDI